MTEELLRSEEPKSIEFDVAEEAVGNSERLVQSALIILESDLNAWLTERIRGLTARGMTLGQIRGIILVVLTAATDKFERL